MKNKLYQLFQYSGLNFNQYGKARQRRTGLNLIHYNLHIINGCLKPICDYICRHYGQSAVNQRTLVFTSIYTFERAFFSNAEYDNIELAFAAEGESGGIHDFEVFQQGFVKSNGFVARGGWVFCRVCGVQSVNVGCFEHHVAVHLRTAQCGGSVGREVRVTGTGGKNHDFAFFQMIGWLWGWRRFQRFA